jgi:hypothetical protein
LREAQGDDPLLGAGRIARALERAGAPASRQRKAMAAAARELFGPLEALTVKRIGVVRRRVLEVRAEAAAVVAASGAAGARLEQIDAALTAATATRTDALYARAVGAYAEAFATELERVVLALPKPCPTLPVEAWVGPDGFVTAHLERCEALVVAAFFHERARVDMLLSATLGEPLR